MSVRLHFERGKSMKRVRDEEVSRPPIGEPSFEKKYDRQIRLWGADAQKR